MDSAREIVYLQLDDIIPNRFQPREVFDEEPLRELASSIKEHGVIQPIIVRQIDNKYEIIAGERRYKAASIAGLTTIPAIIRNLDDRESSKVALIENLQRRDLSAIEEARTYEKILDLDPNMTQEEFARSMGKSQAVIANKLRLLTLPEEIQEALLKDQISERHARSLLTLKDSRTQIEMLNKIRNERLTVRELDVEIKKALGKEHEDDLELRELSERKITNDSRSLAEMLEGDKSALIHPNLDNIGNLKDEEISFPKYQAVERHQNKDLKQDTFDLDDDDEDDGENKSVVPINIKEEQNEEIFLDDSEEKITKLNENFDTLNSLLKQPLVETQKVEVLDENFNTNYIKDTPKHRGFKGVIDIVKGTVSQMKDSGYIVETEEIDFDDNYQIIIKVDKKSIKKTEY